jgi:type IV pilus assembly protein PilX
MLTTISPRIELRGAGYARQQGVILMLALIMLVAMTLAGIALVRSTDTTNIIAGNLAFKLSATSSGDQGTEAAIKYLEGKAADGSLFNNDTGNGYSATVSIASGLTWDAYWTSNLAAKSTVIGGGAEDVAGNKVKYAIERLCQNIGDPVATSTHCSAPQTASSATEGSSQSAQATKLDLPGQTLYRITTRIEGPRNTVSYIQTIVAI